MSRSARITRSSYSSMKNSNDTNHLPVVLQTSENRVRMAIRNKNYDQAQKILQEDTPFRHWHKCLYAKILYQTNEFTRTTKALKTAIYFQREGCYDCLRLLLRFLRTKKQYIKHFSSMISQILLEKQLPKDLKKQFSIISDSYEPDQHQLNHEKLSPFKELLSQYVKKGATFPKLDIYEQKQEYRIAIAKEAIQPRQLIIFVPENQIITLEKARQNEIVKKISDNDSQLRSPKHCILSVYLLIEKQKGDNSAFAKYIKTLPLKLEYFPIYYSAQLLKQLEKTSFLSILKRKLIDLEEDYKDIVKIVGQKQWLTFQNFRWARMIICSRIFGIIMYNNKTDALVPLADMLNHKLPKKATWHFSDKDKGFLVENLDSRIEKGEQIYDSYGSKCNSRFLLNYGFVQSNNQSNQITIQLKKIEHSKMIYQNIRLNINLNSEQFHSLLAHYRRYFYSKSSQREEVDMEEINFDRMISKQIEQKVWAQISNTFSHRLHSFPTTIKFDKKQLSKATDPNYRNCIEIRLGEKIILDFYIRMAKVMKQYFSHPLREINVKDYLPYLRKIGENEPVDQD